MKRSVLACLVVVVAVWLLLPLAAWAEVLILLPQGRTAFQTNEWIDVSVVRSEAKDLGGGAVTLTLAGADGSQVETSFKVEPVVDKIKPSVTHHYHLNGWLLRPGKYKLTAAWEGQKASTDIEVYSHIRQSSFRLVNWGKAKGKEQL